MIKAPRRPVARALSFGGSSDHSEEEFAMVNQPRFVAAPVSVPRKIGQPKKLQPLLVQPENRRFTRSSLKSDGLRPKPVLEQAKPPKAKRAKLLVQRYG
jgi:hypothetical protein